jgi:hypothetical protein
MVGHDPLANSQVILILYNFWLLVCILLNLFAAFNFVHKNLSGFEAGNVVLVNNNGRVARNIARYLFLTFFIDKTSKSTNVNIVPVTHVAFHNSKKCLNRGGYIALVNSGLVCYLVDDV